MTTPDEKAREEKWEALVARQRELEEAVAKKRKELEEQEKQRKKELEEAKKKGAVITETVHPDDFAIIFRDQEELLEEIRAFKEEEEEKEKEDELADQFVVLAEDEDGFALIQFDSKRNTLLYTAKKSQGGRWFKAAIPRSAFFVLVEEAKLNWEKLEQEKLERGEPRDWSI